MIKFVFFCDCICYFVFCLFFVWIRIYLTFNRFDVFDLRWLSWSAPYGIHTGIHMKDGGVKKEKLLYLFQKSIEIFSLAYSTGKYSPSNSGVILVSCGVLLAGSSSPLHVVQSLHPSKLVGGRVGHPESKLMVGINCRNKTVQTF
jgi:hypothetical protein